MNRSWCELKIFLGSHLALYTTAKKASRVFLRACVEEHRARDSWMPPRRRRPGRPGKKKEAPRDLYAELGLSPDASAEDIKKAYRSLALQHHPDKVPSSQREEATAKLAIINTAWDVLGDSERRRVYDLQRADGGADKVGRQGRGLPSFLRKHVLGTEARSLSWWSGVPYLRQRSTGRLQSAMSRRQPCLLFLHLGGSARSLAAASSELSPQLRRPSIQRACSAYRRRPEKNPSLCSGLYSSR